MPATGYRYAGNFLAQAGGIFDVQKKNMGILELQIDRIVPGAKEPLILSLEKFEVPGRKIGTGVLPYLNGNAQYLTRPEKLDNVKITLRDYPLVGTRAYIDQWFRLCYDEVTGLMLPSGLIKINGFLVLMQGDATAARTATLYGLQLTNRPGVSVNYGDGSHMTMDLDLAIDSYVPNPDMFNPS